MDILVKTQATGDINIIVSLTINNGTSAEVVDTGATLTVKAINPDGSENSSFTSPTISEVIASSGVYKLTFPSAAANKLFTLADEINPYTLLVKTATAGSAFYRAVRVYCVSRLPGEYAKSTEIAALDTVVDTVQTTVDAIPTLAEILAGGVALDSTVAKAATVALDSTVAKEATVSARPTLATIEASTVLAKAAAVTALQATADALPTLSEVEASTVLAKEAGITLIKKLIKNKKVLVASGSVYSLVVYDDNDIDEIMRKVIKDVAGADITAIGTGVIAREMKSSV